MFSYKYSYFNNFTKHKMQWECNAWPQKQCLWKVSRKVNPFVELVVIMLLIISIPFFDFIINISPYGQYEYIFNKKGLTRDCSPDLLLPGFHECKRQKMFLRRHWWIANSRESTLLSVLLTIYVSLYLYRASCKKGYPT